MGNIINLADRRPKPAPPPSPPNMSPMEIEIPGVQGGIYVLNTTNMARIILDAFTAPEPPEALPDYDRVHAVLQHLAALGVGLEHIAAEVLTLRPSWKQ